MITKRGSRWAVRVYRGGGDYEWVGTFSTKRDAQAAERAALAKPKLAGAMTCDAFADHWLVEYARPAAASRRTNSYALKSFKNDFEGIKLADVDRPMARAWALSNSHYNVRVVRAMFNDALRDGYVHVNPFSNQRLEQSRGRRDLKVITEDELKRLVEIGHEVHGTFGPTFEAMIMFSAYVGVRPGEMYVLERDDVDFANGEVQIRQSLDVENHVKLPKNNNIRTVTLPPPAADALQRMPVVADDPLVFRTMRGRRFSKASHYYYWRPVRAVFGRPEMDWYDLRHFCATMFLEKGLSHADVAVQLGHTDGGKLVMSTYGHPSEQLARGRLKAVFEQQAA